LLKVFISCRRFLVELLESLTCTIISSSNKDMLTSSFLTYIITLITFKFCTALAKTSSTFLNRYGESRWPCLVPDFGGISLSFSPLDWYWVWACCKLPLLYWCLFLISLISQGVSSRSIGFCEEPFPHLIQWSCSSFLSIWLYGRLRLSIHRCWTQILHLWDEAEWMIFDIFFDLFSNYCIEKSCTYVHKGNGSVINSLPSVFPVVWISG